MSPLIRAFARGLREYFIDASKQLLSGPAQSCRWGSKLERWQATIQSYMERDLSAGRYPVKSERWNTPKSFVHAVQELQELVPARIAEFANTVLCSRGYNTDVWDEGLKPYPISSEWLDTDGDWDESYLGVKQFSEWIPPWEQDRAVTCHYHRTVPAMTHGSGSVPTITTTSIMSDPTTTRNEPVTNQATMVELTGAIQISVTGVTKEHMQTAAKATLAALFQVDASLVTHVIAVETRRLQDSTARQLAGSWSVSFKIAAPAHKVASIQTYVAQMNKGAFTTTLGTELTKAGATPVGLTVTSVTAEKAPAAADASCSQHLVAVSGIALVAVFISTCLF